MLSASRSVASRPQAQALSASRPRLGAGCSVQRVRTLAFAAAQQSAWSSCTSWTSTAALRRSLVGRSHDSNAACSRRCVRVHASWGAPVEFSPAKVLSNTKAAKSLHKILVDVGADIAAGYTKPGQFVQLKVGESKPGFFAIASPPDANNGGALEILVKAAGDTAEALCALEQHAEVSVSPVMGKGFPIERVPPSAFPTLLMFATGSGISPIKALIESGALETEQRRDVRLYYGTRNADATAYAELLPDWEAAGLKVIQVFSEEGSTNSSSSSSSSSSSDSSTDSSEGRYVQDVFALNSQFDMPSAVGVVACGQKDMVNAVKGLLGARGVDVDQQVLLNF